MKYFLLFLVPLTELRTKSTRTLSDFNFQCTKTLYQNNLKNITFFFYIFIGQRCNKSSVITPKKISEWKSEKVNVKFHKNCHYTCQVKFLKIACVRCNFVKFDFYFLGLPSEIFFGVTKDDLSHHDL